jgi:hypothetical protein
LISGFGWLVLHVNASFQFHLNEDKTKLDSQSFLSLLPKAALYRLFLFDLFSLEVPASEDQQRSTSWRTRTTKNTKRGGALFGSASEQVSLVLVGSASEQAWRSLVARASK